MLKILVYLLHSGKVQNIKCEKHISDQTWPLNVFPCPPNPCLDALHSIVLSGRKSERDLFHRLANYFCRTKFAMHPMRTKFKTAQSRSFFENYRYHFVSKKKGFLALLCCVLILRRRMFVLSVYTSNFSLLTPASVSM